MRAERLLFAPLLVLVACLPACGDKSDPCAGPLSATFETVPNGPIAGQLTLGGMRLSPAGVGAVTVLRDMTPIPAVPAVYLANEGTLVVFADCDAHAVELAFDASDAPLMIELIAGDTGGGSGSDGGSPPSHRVAASDLASTADTVSGYRRATVTMPDGGKLRRVELRAGGGNVMGTAGVLIRLVGFSP